MVRREHSNRPSEHPSHMAAVSRNKWKSQESTPLLLVSIGMAIQQMVYDYPIGTNF